MNVTKRVIGELEKCYSIAPLQMNDQSYFLVAAEKHDSCYLFDYAGKQISEVWKEPGGVMNMVQIPNTNGCFLAVHQFYSPNDSKNAKIVYVRPENASWKITTILELPFVHRFDILERNNQLYIIACTIKSHHEYKDDWRSPGKVYFGKLPSDLENYNEKNQIKVTPVQEGLTKNHGYFRNGEDVLIFSQQGAYKLEWKENNTVRFHCLLDIPCSDGAFVDLDGDGVQELAVISPFHGDRFLIYKKNGDVYEKVYEYQEPLEFLHAIYGGKVAQKERVIIGNRKGERLLLSISYEDGRYVSEILDRDTGAANVTKITHNGIDYLIATNREINEIAMYQCE